MAKRVRGTSESVPNLVEMSTVTCDQCGARFAIGHRLFFQDVELANRQAVWLGEQLVWDHIQENKHRGSIRLPASNEMK
jgi:chorismate-pyruvate lyase